MIKNLLNFILLISLLKITTMNIVHEEINPEDSKNQLLQP